MACSIVTLLFRLFDTRHFISLFSLQHLLWCFRGSVASFTDFICLLPAQSLLWCFRGSYVCHVHSALLFPIHGFFGCFRCSFASFTHFISLSLWCFRGSFTHFICLLAIDGFLMCFRGTLSVSCLHRVFCDVSEAITLALCTLLRFIALPDCALRLEGKRICTLPVSRELSLTTIDDRVSRLCACSGKTRVRLPLKALARLIDARESWLFSLSSRRTQSFQENAKLKSKISQPLSGSWRS